MTTPWPLTPRRRDDPELMDAPGLPAVEVADAYRVLQRVNRQFFGSLGSLRAELTRFCRDEYLAASATVSMLDLGSGSGDLPADARATLRALGISPLTLALDHDPTATRLASRFDLPALQGDALRLPFADRSIDLVTAVKFAHHFHGEPLTRLLGEMARVARRRVLILDLQRHWLAYVGFVAWSRVFTRNRLVRYDGPLSVLRGFTSEELKTLAAPISQFSWTVRAYSGFQLALVGRRLD